jgi:hypothetical protein
MKRVLRLAKSICNAQKAATLAACCLFVLNQ